MSATMVNQRRKIKKKKHWLKHAKAVSQKTKLDQNINDSKSNIAIFFLKMLFEEYNFGLHVPVDII